MNKIEFIKEKIPFTQVANEVLCDKRITAKAKGLYAYLYSKPQGWDFAVERISFEMADGIKAVNSGLQELESFGLLTREKQSDGRVIYTVHFPPKEPNVQNGHKGEKPNVQNGRMPKRQIAEMDIISNKDSIIIKNINNKDIAMVPLVIDLFCEINPACKNMYGNNTQRKACQDLLDTYGFEEVKNCIQNVLPKTNTMEFVPVITTPVQLRDKWATLKSTLSKKRSKTIEIIN